MAEHRFAKEIHVDAEALRAQTGEMLGQGRIRRVGDQVSDQCPEAPPSQWHDDVRKDE
jgi:hypothetical protein